MRTPAALLFALLPVLSLYVGACVPPPREVGISIRAEPDTIHLDETGRLWAEQVLDTLSLEKQVAQLFAVSVEGAFEASDPKLREYRVRLVRDLGIGGVIFFQGSPVEQAAFANELQELAPVPLLVSQDMEWGAGMRLEGATSFPAAMAIAATGDPRLAYDAGVATAREARAVGVRQVFAPVADVNTDPNNPVIDTRSFSDRPERVATFVREFVRGVQDGGVLATVKHFPGHGDTDEDSHESLPVSRLGFAELDSIHLEPFRAAVGAGVASVMTAHVAYPEVDTAASLPATLSPLLVDGLLRDSLGFDGLVVSDALNMSAVARLAPPAEVAVMAVEAGVDMLLMSTDIELAHRAVVNAVRSGRIDSTWIERSVRRILQAKASAGLHIDRITDLDHVRTTVGNSRSLALAELIAERSLTLLAGDLPVLGLNPTEHVLVVTVSDRTGAAPGQVFRAALRDENPDAEFSFLTVDPSTVGSSRPAIARGVARSDRVIVAAHAFAGRWKQRPRTAAALSGLIDDLTTGDKPATLVVFGSPYMLSGLQHLPERVLLAYDSGDVVQRAAAGALSGSVTVSGRLPVTVPATYAYGSGRSVTAIYPHRNVPEFVGMDGASLSQIDSLIRGAIEHRAFPGAAVAVGRGGSIAHLATYGYFTYESERRISTDAAFDLASLTKVVATTTAMMRLYEDGLVDLDAPVSRYVPEFGQAGKDRVTVRQLLSHTGGLIPFRPFYSMGIRTRQGVLDAIFADSLVYEPGTESRYSDFGPITLAILIERVTGQPFARYVRENVFEPLGMWHTGYRRAGAFDPAAVPTEVDDYFRNRTLQGEVHDENAWLLGGTAGHAGLFSTITDLSRFATMLVHEGRIGDRQFIQPETVRLFTTPVDSLRRHTRALGWDTRTPEGYSSAGQLFGPRSFGHTGFTGTSMWIDPDARLYVVLLANRVYPTRDNSGHVPIRPALADLAYLSVRSRRTDPLRPSVTD